MDNFGGKIAVVTGGGTGMGRELVHQLAGEGCHVATCDVSGENLAAAAELARADAPTGTRVTTFIADVGDESQLEAFADAVRAEHETDHVNLLFNNAGIGGGASMIASPRGEWDRTFAVDWGGVYGATRVFLPLLLEADEGHVVNTSSVNGFYAALGPQGAHTAYSAAKFAVKGFTEALVTDFRANAPHLHAHVVMPGHIGTSIVTNTNLVHEDDLKDEDVQVRRRELLESFGFPADEITEEALDNVMTMIGEGFKNMAPMTAAEAATVILEGVRANRWRILVGVDAHDLDEMIRANPESAYDVDFWPRFQAKGHFGGVSN